MQGNVMQFPPGGGSGGKRNWDPLKKLTPNQAAERTGIPVSQIIKLFKVHGLKFGRRYYMSEALLMELLDEKRVHQG